MNAVQPFQFGAVDVRVLADDDHGPLFVAADVARVLGYRDAGNMVRRLDAEDRGTRSVSTPGGEQEMTVITEAGLYVAVLGSQVPSARAFKRWVTREVLPAIRKTGSYQVAALSPRELAELVIAEADRADRAEALVLEQAPKVQVAERLLNADGDMSVADAAKVLKGRAGIKDMGRDRLFSLLHTWGWTYRQAGRWTPKQTAIETGRLSIQPQSHYHPRTGELVMDPPQVRVTAKGLQKILAGLTANELEAAS